MTSEWFYQVMGKQVGPVSSAELLALAQRGTVTYDTPVRKGRDGKCVSAKRVRGLFCVPNATSPLMPTPASVPSQNQPADTPPQEPSQPLASNPQPVPPVMPTGATSRLTPIGNVGAILPTSAPTEQFLKSIAFLQNASAVSRTHAIELLGQFGDLLKTEVDSFSGSHSLQEVENLVNELTRVPDVMRSFFGRTPTVKPMEAKAVEAIKDMVCGYYRQLRASITQIEPKSTKMEQLLRLVCDAENAMSPVRKPTPTVTPNGEPCQLTAIGNIDAVCPYCGNRLEKKPGRKKKCPHCGNFIRVRTRPLDNKKVLVTEKQMEAINEQWGIVHPPCAIAQAVADERAGSLSSRTFTDWEGITEATSARLGQILADGVAHGRHPREVARRIAEELGINRERAFSIAHTEIMRCHSEGQLDAMEDMGVTELRVAVEWSTAGDDRVCELCEPLHGIVLTAEEARGLLPRHDGCRCCWTPANVGEKDEGQKRTKKAIDKAIDKSVKAEIPNKSNRTPAEQKACSSWRGARLTTAKTRPKSIL